MRGEGERVGTIVGTIGLDWLLGGERVGTIGLEGIAVRLVFLASPSPRSSPY